MTKSQMSTIPELSEYMSVSQVALLFGITKVTVYDWIYGKKFQHAYRIGDLGDRPQLVILRSEVEAMHREVVARKARSTPEKRMADWNRRVKQWARDAGWVKTRIAVTGWPPVVMIQAYLEAHPEDPKPE